MNDTQITFDRLDEIERRQLESASGLHSDVAWLIDEVRKALADDENN